MNTYAHSNKLTSLPVLFLVFFCFSCRKEKMRSECAIPAIVPFQPYSDPVWHPNGKLLGFNHTPQAAVYANGIPPCVWYMNSVKQDSAGFYLMNKDGTGFRRVTNFYLNTPAWSPDGNWIAFSVPPNIYKMQFDGNTLDTSYIIQLTDSGANFYPTWTLNNDTIYYDSNNDAPSGTGFYSIWKMSSDGTGKTRITESVNVGDTRQPFVASDGLIYYQAYVLGQSEIFSMKKDGSNSMQLTYNETNDLRGTPKYWQGKIFYQDNGLWEFTLNGSSSSNQLSTQCITYDISQSGEIIYVKWDYTVSPTDLQRGTLWIMNADGSNKKQLTFNNF